MGGPGNTELVGPEFGGRAGALGAEPPTEPEGSGIFTGGGPVALGARGGGGTRPPLVDGTGTVPPDVVIVDDWWRGGDITFVVSNLLFSCTFIAVMASAGDRRG